MTMEAAKPKTTYKKYLQDDEPFKKAPRTTQWRMKKRKLTLSSENVETETVEDRPQASLNGPSGDNDSGDFEILTLDTVSDR